MKNELNCKGLRSDQIEALQEKYGKNELVPQKNPGFFSKVLHIVSEPMFLLLIAAAIIYFVLGEPRDGAIMLVFVVGIISIDVIQEWKTDRTLKALKDLSAPHITVIRDGKETVVASTELLPGDLMMIFEGVKIPADGLIIKCNDLCIDESSLTGEAEGVWKVQAGISEPSDDYWRKDYCYAGTLVTQGGATILVEKIGAKTEYGKIGVSVASTSDKSTPLQKQTGSLIKLCAGIAAVLFALVSILTYFNIPDYAPHDRIIASILSGITLAMAMIPEEFPVVLTVFLSMGAWRLAKKKSLVRKLPSVETLGAVSVLCVDKTGTITENRMAVQKTWAVSGDTKTLCETMGLGCEIDTYDPMEKAMLAHCESLGILKDDIFSGDLIKEYAFTDESKMMGHVWEKDSGFIIAAKGSPEHILTICSLSDEEKEDVLSRVEGMSKQGYRTIAVARSEPKNELDIPSSLADASLDFLGLIGLADPPRKSVQSDIAICNNAGIRVVMITGDNGITASAIAKKVGIPNCDNVITGDMLNKMSDEQLRQEVRTVSIFARVIPEHKMRIVKAFKDCGEIVAMTGDGVNDASALKYSNIGIAMGGRGSEVSREAADLILLDDNFTTIVETVKDGRKIYDNIRKAIGYIFTIHIPIALASLLAPLLGISPEAVMLLPLHVVLLELIIDPTCSIVLERQPPEADIMNRNPRASKEKLLSKRLVFKSIIQGIAIFAASFGTYFVVLAGSEDNTTTARSMGLIIVMLSNLFLVQVNSSNHDFVYKSIALLIRDRVMWAINIITVLGVVAILYTPLSDFLKLAPLSVNQFFFCVGISAAAVLWYELVKLARKLGRRKDIT